MYTTQAPYTRADYCKVIDLWYMIISDIHWPLLMFCDLYSYRLTFIDLLIAILLYNLLMHCKTKTMTILDIKQQNWIIMQNRLLHYVVCRKLLHMLECTVSDMCTVIASFFVTFLCLASDCFTSFLIIILFLRHQLPMLRAYFLYQYKP